MAQAIATSTIGQFWPWIRESSWRHHSRLTRSCTLPRSTKTQNLGIEEKNDKAGSRSSEATERMKLKNRRPATGKTLESRLMRRLGQTLRDRHLLGPEQRILVAVSGGQDSVCLIHLLVKLQTQWGWKIGIAHCDHQWSSASRQQASHVAQMAQSWGLDYYQALTASPVLGEGAARTWRYGVLQRIAVSHGYDAIVTAHTANDRVETLLFNVFRGSGLQGLQSLTWKRLISKDLSLSRESAFQQMQPIDSVEDPLEGIKSVSEMDSSALALVRPLLDVTRTELRELCRELELPLWPDPSNHSLDIDRNRIRHQLLPYLRKHFNPGVDKSLARWAEILQAEEEYLNNLCESIRGKVESRYVAEPDESATLSGAEVGRKLDVLPLRSLPIAIQRRILKQFSDEFTGKNLGFDIVERVREALMDLSIAPNGLQVSVPGGFFIRIRGNYVIIARSQAKEMQN